jgi:NAD(P)-dependent dehydrogenase (short-subunit alcohol dehydrogenase family)
MTTRPEPGTAPEPELYDSLDGQVALVTGANRGLGEEIASQLVELGATVFAGVRSVTYDVPDGCESLVMDVTQEGDVQNAINQIGDEAGRLDILVNNAGYGSFDDPLHEEETATIDRTISVNLRGPMLLAKYAVPPLLEQDGPRIVNLSSQMGSLSEKQPGGAASYRISKTGINGLTAYLHGEYADEGLLANAVCPGWVQTRMGGEDAPRDVASGAETPVWLTRLKPDTVGGALWHDREVVDW